MPLHFACHSTRVSARWLVTAAALLSALLAGPSPARAAGPERPKLHVVYAGQRLGSIAKRYNVSIDAICTANDIRRRDPIRPGQRLIIPERSDKDGTRAREAALKRSGGERSRSAKTQSSTSKKKEPSYQDYKKTPRRKAYVEVITHTGRWRGLVLDSKGRIRAPARKAIGTLLGATGPRPKVPDGLIRLMVKVSDTFGGRPLRVVSGYRSTSYFRDSRHKTSEAIDFHIPGVPNAAVYDYLLTLGKVGVGYYPNSTFLHLDVRPSPTRWVDYSGPGEAPRRTAERAHAAAHADLDDQAEEAAENAPEPGSLPEAPLEAPASSP